MCKGYTGMELLEAKLAALIIVLAVVVVALAVVQNKQGEPLRAFIL